MLRRHGGALLAALRQGAGEPPPEAPLEAPLSGRQKEWVRAVLESVRERCGEAEVAVRLVANRADAEALVRWWSGRDDGGGAAEPDLPLLVGWRREVAGAAALARLAELTAGG